MYVWAKTNLSLESFFSLKKFINKIFTFIQDEHKKNATLGGERQKLLSLESFSLKKKCVKTGRMFKCIKNCVCKKCQKLRNFKIHGTHTTHQNSIVANALRNVFRYV